MDKQIYYEALDKNDHMPLEDLADQYDFNSVFNPLRSAFMLEDCDRHFTWADFSDDKRFNRREYWNDIYCDKFTRSKVVGMYEYFIDCWTLKENKKLVIAAGEFPHGDIVGDRDSLKAEFLYKVRNQIYFPKNGPFASALVLGTFIGWSTDNLVAGIAAGIFAGIITSNRLRLHVPNGYSAIDYIIDKNK